ncbi:MAG: hypothetical protein ACRDJP_09895 [Actinomycetota bacterium]
MSAPVRLAAFALVLLLAFGAGLGLGSAAGPFGDDTEAPTHGEHP